MCRLHQSGVVYASLFIETRTRRHRHQLIPTYLESVGIVEAPGAPCRPSADELPDGG